MEDNGGEVRQYQLLARISKTSRDFLDSLARARATDLPAGKVNISELIDNFLLSLAAKDPRGRDAILEAAAKQATAHLAAVEQINAKVRSLLPRGMSTILEWQERQRADGESEEKAVRAQMEARQEEQAKILARGRDLYTKQAVHRRRDQKLDWARSFLSDTGRALNMTADQLLRKLEGGGA